MARPKLDMTCEERKIYDRDGVNKRKRKQREKDSIAKTAVLTPELEEFVEELILLPLNIASMALAIWQKENRQKFPSLVKPGEASDCWAARMKRLRRFLLIRMFAADAIPRDNARARKGRFYSNENEAASELGMTVEAFRKHKLGRRLADKMAKIVADRNIACKGE
ncbi:hypothetical protein [Agrobacterium burrii]